MLESTYTNGDFVFEMKMIDPTHVSVVSAVSEAFKTVHGQAKRYPVTYHIGQLELGTPVGDCAASLRKVWKDSGLGWTDYLKREEAMPMYLDYVNNFLTIERWAEYYGMSMEEANGIYLMCKEN